MKWIKAKFQHFIGSNVTYRFKGLLIVNCVQDVLLLVLWSWYEAKKWGWNYMRKQRKARPSWCGYVYNQIRLFHAYLNNSETWYIAIERDGRMYMDCVSGASLVAFSNALCEMIMINFVKSKIHYISCIDFILFYSNANKYM